MDVKDRAMYKLLALEHKIKKYGSYAFLYDMAKIYTMLLEGKIDEDECYAGVQSIVHDTKTPTDVKINMIDDEDWESMVYYEWGTEMTQDDAMFDVEDAVFSLKNAQEYCDVPTDLLDKYKLFKVDITMDELYDFTQDQMVALRGECEDLYDIVTKLPIRGDL